MVGGMKHDPVIGGGFVLILRSQSFRIPEAEPTQFLMECQGVVSVRLLKNVSVRVKMFLDSTLVGFVFLRRFGLLG